MDWSTVTSPDKNPVGGSGTAAPSSPGPSESLLALFLDGIADFAYMKDTEGRYLAINAAGARFVGKAPSEIIGLDDAALFGDKEAQRIREDELAVLASGGSMSFEEEIVLGGQTTYLKTIKTVCRDSNGTVIGLVGIARDIGEQKELERLLRDRERDLLEAHRIAKLGTWRWDRKTGRTTWSDEIYRIFGMDPAEPPLVYQEFLKRTDHTASEKQFIEAFERLIHTGEPYTLDIEIKRADGTIAWNQSRGEVERWENGQVVSLRGTVHEITERKLQEERLALSENRYRSLVYASSQIVWTTSAAGDQMNKIPEWQAFTGQSDEEVLGQRWSEAIHPDDRARSLERWAQCMATGSAYKMEERVRRHDGVYRNMAVHAVPVRDAQGAIVEWVGTHTDVTEQKLAQDELQLANQRLQNVLDSITDGLCVLDRDWRYIYFNDNGARLIGLRAADIVGKQFGDVFKENKTNAFGQGYRRAVETGKTVHFENFYGEPLNKWFEANCYPSADGLTVYFRDVTERKKIEEALRDSESRYRKLFESNMMGICRPDRFGAFKEGNDELLRITGYTRAELEAGLVRWDTMTPTEYGELDAHHIREAAERGSCTPYEKEYIRKDGSRVPILCGYALLEGSQDEYVGFVFDLTRQRAAEAGLREREERFRLLAESLPELVWVTDPIGSLTYLNQRFLEYCGIVPKQMIGFNWQGILHPEEVDRVNSAWSHSVMSGQPYQIELQLRRADGAFRHFLARAQAMRDDAGRIVRWVGSCTDVHDQKLAEDALRRSEKLAATGRLAASIAHEINNPLSAVLNSLYLAMLDSNLAGQTRGFLETAEKELARVSHITTQTLRFHRQSKAAATADLSETMSSVLALFQARFTARQIEVCTEYEPGVQILCLEDEMRQVFANFVSNSLDATPDGGKLHIRIRKNRLRGEPGVRVTIGDNGSGIPLAIRKRIFEPFFSTKDATGIGLGLWVTEGVIRKHGGHLKVRSSADAERHWTVFSVFLPKDGVGKAE
jgi:PAS domain S-box-containing protein